MVEIEQRRDKEKIITTPSLLKDLVSLVQTKFDSSGVTPAIYAAAVKGLILYAQLQDMPISSPTTLARFLGISPEQAISALANNKYFHVQSWEKLKGPPWAEPYRKLLLGLKFDPDTDPRVVANTYNLIARIYPQLIQHLADAKTNP